MTRRQFLSRSAGISVFGVLRSVAAPTGAWLADGLRKPTSYANLKLWLDGHTLASLNDGDPIATWVDSSGLGHDATQGTPGNRPAKGTYSLNGRTYPVFVGAGTAKTLVTTSFLGSGFNTACTIIVAHQNDNNTLNLYASSGGINLYCGEFTSASYNTQGLSDTQITTPVASANDPKRMRIVTFRYDGANKVLRIDGVQRNSEAATGNMGLSGTLTIGDLSSGGFPYSGKLAHFLMFDRALTDRELQFLERWLALQVGISVAPSIACDGDSITAGNLCTGLPYPAQLLTLLGNQWSMWNLGIVGQTVATMVTNGAGKVDPLMRGFDRRKIVCCFGGSNDLFGGATATTTYNSIVSYCQARQAAGAKVVVFTLLPRSNVGTPGSFEADRQTVNTNIRNNLATFADALADVGADANIGVAGASDDTTYYCDKVHTNGVGNAIIAGLAESAIVPLIT